MYNFIKTKINKMGTGAKTLKSTKVYPSPFRWFVLTMVFLCGIIKAR